MGTNAYAYTIIGIQLPLSALTTIHKYRGCNDPETSDKFCSRCGAPMWHEEKDTATAIEELQEKLKQFPKSLQLGIVEDHDAQLVYVGTVIEPEYDKVSANIPFNEIPNFQVIKETLENLNLDARNFGIWTHLYWSY